MIFLLLLVVRSLIYFEGMNRNNAKFQKEVELVVSKTSNQAYTSNQI